jgi:hypothetical protein
MGNLCSAMGDRTLSQAQLAHPGGAGQSAGIMVGLPINRIRTVPALASRMGYPQLVGGRGGERLQPLDKTSGYSIS